MTKNVVVVIGIGGLGLAIARRLASNNVLILADRSDKALETAAEDLRAAGHYVETQSIDISSRASVKALAATSAARGPVHQVVLAAGISPNMAPIEKILEVDLYGSAVVLEEFGSIIARGGAGLVISSAGGYRIPEPTPEQNHALAFTPTEELLALPFLQAGEIETQSYAYRLSKRANCLRVQAECLRWGERGARLNSMSPGLIATPMGMHELNSVQGAQLRAKTEAAPAGRIGTPDEIATAAAFLLSPEASFITGSDLLIDGGGVAVVKAGVVTEKA